MYNIYMISLGIETSCDETSVCLLMDKKILSLQTFSQVDLHSVYGGVVPEIASRDHLSKISTLMTKCIAESGISVSDIGVISYTSHPGLIGSLLTGIMFAKGISLSISKPLVEVNHREAHVFTCNITHGVSREFMCLLVSGGHTSVYCVDSDMRCTEVCSSVDDSVGEVYDKVSKSLGFGYPGGAIIEELAKYGDGKSYNLTVPLRNSMSFSFSGLKTQCLKIIQGIFAKYDVVQHLTHTDILKSLNCSTCNTISMYSQDVANLCASFQVAILHSLTSKLEMLLCSGAFKYKKLSFCGGVASNTFLRDGITSLCEMYGVDVFIPDKYLCTDNAAMVANMGILMLDCEL